MTQWIFVTLEQLSTITSEASISPYTNNIPTETLMGYLTTFTVYNDGLDLIQKHPTEFAEKVYYAARKQETHDVGLSGFCNFMHVQQSRHADDHTTYVHMGNCVTEVNPYSREFKELMKKCPDFADKLIKFLDDEVKALKKLKKEMKEKTNA